MEGDGLHYNQDFTRPPHLVTNGPYRLAEWSFKRRLRMVASEFYWNRANVKSKVSTRFMPMTGWRRFGRMSGAMPIGSAIWIRTWRRKCWSAAGASDLHIFPAFGTYFYSLNCLPNLPDGRKNPLADVRVRQALSMAIDREPIVRNVGRIGQPPSLTYIPPHVFEGYSSPPGLAYDPDQARKLLADAGYPNGRGISKPDDPLQQRYGISRRYRADHPPAMAG